MAHDEHPGIAGTKTRSRTKFYRPAIDRDLEQKVKTCHQYPFTGRPNQPESLTVTRLPKKPWTDLSVDFLGHIQPTNQYVMFVVDYYSHFYDYSEKLAKIFIRYGIPTKLKSDDGSQFISAEFAGCLTLLGINHYLVTPRWPQANGKV